MRWSPIHAVVLVAGWGAQAVLAQNMLLNPDFASDVAGWTTDGDVTLVWSSEDASNNPASGSAEVANLYATASQGAGILQCVAGAVVAGTSYDFGGKAFIPTGQARTGLGQVGLRWYDGPACSGAAVGEQPRRQTETLDAWVELAATDQIAPTGAASVLFLAFPTKWEAGGSFVVRFDDLYLTPTPIFADGFESGDTGAWSVTSPP